MINRLYSAIIVTLLVSGCSLSAAATWPWGLEHNISPCKSEAIRVGIPSILEQDHTRMHGVIIDQQSNNKYLIYEPLGNLRAEVRANGTKALLCAALGITLGVTGLYFAKPNDTSLLINPLKKIIKGYWAQGSIYSCAAAFMWGCRTLLWYNALRDSQWNPEQHSVLSEPCATTLKKIMRLPTHTSIQHLCFEKLNANDSQQSEEVE